MNSIQKPNLQSGEQIDLYPTGDAQVMVYPADYDAFAMSQREAVDALKSKHKWMAVAEIMKTKTTDLFIDLAEWGSKNPNVRRVVWQARTDDVLIVIIAEDEDEEGELHDIMAQLDLDLYEKYNFRLHFLLLRYSEAEGLSSFADSRGKNDIYNVKNKDVMIKSKRGQIKSKRGQIKSKNIVTNAKS